MYCFFRTYATKHPILLTLFYKIGDISPKSVNFYTLILKKSSNFAPDLYRVARYART